VILAIDTSGIQCAAALWKKQLVSSRVVEEGLRHNELLLKLIDEVLREHAVEAASLQALAVSSGPGSFTGLRVGMATAKGLCRAWNVPIVAIPTLEGLAAAVPKKIKRVLSLMPARASEVYWQLFERNGADRYTVGDAQLADILELGSLIKGDVFLTGEGYQRHQEELDTVFQGRLIKLQDMLRTEPLVVSTARLAYERFKHEDFDDLIDLEPRYCYPFPRRIH
jgi:tRNA threonylcarbamoyladenosine biosynthesis protein TsaB